MEKDVVSGAAEVLNSIRERLKQAKGINDIRLIAAEETKCKPDDLKDFHYKVKGHDWIGVIYVKRNRLMGSIFSLFDSKPFVVRG